MVRAAPLTVSTPRSNLLISINSSIAWGFMSTVKASDRSGLPSVDRILRLPEVESLEATYGRSLVTEVTRGILADIRRGADGRQRADELPTETEIVLDQPKTISFQVIGSGEDIYTFILLAN